MSPTSVHSAINELKEKSYIIVEQELGKRKFKLSPGHTWKGSNINQVRSAKEWKTNTV